MYKRQVIDTVEYRNLVPGKEYTLNGKRHSKSNGKPLMVGDKPVTGPTLSLIHIWLDAR